MKKNILLLILILWIVIPLRSQDESRMVIISIEISKISRGKICEMQLDMLMAKDNRIYLHVSPEDIVSLQKANIPYAFEAMDPGPFAAVEASSQGGINGEFHSYAELERDLFSLEESYPELVRVTDIGDSLEMRNIYALKISDNVHAEEANEADVLFLGCHHAREWISVEVPFLLGKYLAEHYSIDPTVKKLVDQCEIWIVPLVNPDGLEYSIHFYRYWRKNRRNNRDGSYGVDPNRNYGFKWGIDNLGSSPDPSSEVYRGESPFSEPETRSIRNLYQRHRFRVLASYHSYSQILLYPWGYTSEPTDKYDLLSEMAETMSNLMEPVNGRVYGYAQAGADFYFTNGDTTDWSYGTYGIPSFTVELPPIDEPHGGFFNAEEDIQDIFRENLPAMLYLIEWASDHQNEETDTTNRYENQREFPLQENGRIHLNTRVKKGKQ
jgi:carboxypeptidase T